MCSSVVVGAAVVLFGGLQLGSLSLSISSVAVGGEARFCGCFCSFHLTLYVTVKCRQMSNFCF